MIAARKILFWFAVSALSLLVMLQPARAAGVVASVLAPPVTGCSDWQSANPSYPFYRWGSQSDPFGAVVSYSHPWGQMFACWLGTSESNYTWEHGILGVQACPTNSSGSPCTCNTGFNADTTGTSCVAVAACPVAGTLYSQSKNMSYHGGETLPLKLCVASCEATNTYQRFHSSVGLVLVGQTTYFFNAAYHYSGQSCSPDTPDLPQAYNSLPEQSCAPGQSMISMGGRTKCFDSGTGLQVETRTASAIAAAETLAAQRAAAAASAVAAATTAAAIAAAAAGGDASAVQAATVQAAAQYAADNSTPTEQKDPCTDSTRIGCMDTGEVPDADAIEERNLDFSTFAFNTYTFTGTAACPAPRTLSLTRGLVPFSYQPFCDFLNVFKFAALALAMFVAALIMLGQRSSDSGG